MTLLVEKVLRLTHTRRCVLYSLSLRLLCHPCLFVFDGVSSGTTHFVEVFATFSVNTFVGYASARLSFFLIKNGIFQDAAKHANSLVFVLLNLCEEKEWLQSTVILPT